MPTYKLRNKSTKENFEVFCTYAELQEKLKADPELVHMLSTPQFITQTGMTINKTSDGWKDVLSKVKKSSTKNNTINN